ncbi:nucleotidyl transferase AbiEii/AbiGii toxin family protein [bacterium]|nr:nucleotidyl transferase AbiEii/AbiGii toxin family protein [bacterium]
MDVSAALIGTLERVSAILAGEHIGHCLIGGLAVSMLSRPRATEDVDLIIAVGEPERARVLSALASEFRVVQDQLMQFQRARIWRILLASPSGSADEVVVVDFLLADREPYTSAVSNAMPVRIGSVAVPVARKENLIAVKRISNRPIDVIDIESLQNASDDTP